MTSVSPSGGKLGAQGAITGRWGNFEDVVNGGKSLDPWECGHQKDLRNFPGLLGHSYKKMVIKGTCPLFFLSLLSFYLTSPLSILDKIVTVYFNVYSRHYLPTIHNLSWGSPKLT